MDRVLLQALGMEQGAKEMWLLTSGNLGSGGEDKRQPSDL